MERELFSLFVAKTLKEVIALAEQKANQQISRKLAFQWLGKGQPRVTENIVDYIVQRVFIDSEHIYPCVDIGVGDLLDDGSLLIVANVSGYTPCTFRANWTGREGPFVHVVGQAFLARIAGKAIDGRRHGNFGFIIPGLERSK
jgi:hypothetical protein